MQKIWSLNILDVATKLGITYSGRGNYRKCKCFMHDDKHPSMWFKMSNNTWSCPVCDKGGGLVSLVMEHESLNFHDAVDWLIHAFDIWVCDDNNNYRPPKPKRSTLSSNLSTLSSKPSSREAPLSSLNSNLIKQCQRTDTTFCRSLVSTGILTQAQMLHAAEVFHLGATKDGGVIFWNIDESHQVRQGKIMWYLEDCHRDHHRNPSTVSYRLISQGLLAKDWTATKCFFGLHQLTPLTSNLSTLTYPTTIAIVESEKTAVICSELLSSLPMGEDGERGIWLSCGGLSQLTPEMFLPLKGYKIILFPDTDPKGEAHKQWTQKAHEAMQLLGHPIYVSDLLEQHATEDQKRRKIDLADYLIEGRQPTVPQSRLLSMPPGQD